jgi:hypothetical protein
LGIAPTPPIAHLPGGESPPRVPRWEDVEEVIERLSRTGASLPTSLGRENQIAAYHRGSRLMLGSKTGSRWIPLDDIRECWQTFERLGRIRRHDVLEPGRCSGFMLALFAQVPGVVEQFDPDCELVLPA